MDPRRRNPLRRYPTAVCISVLHFELTRSKMRALNSPGTSAATPIHIAPLHIRFVQQSERRQFC